MWALWRESQHRERGAIVVRYTRLLRHWQSGNLSPPGLGGFFTTKETRPTNKLPVFSALFGILWGWKPQPWLLEALRCSDLRAEPFTVLAQCFVVSVLSLLVAEIPKAALEAKGNRQVHWL